jgi:hypothetical protein
LNKVFAESFPSGQPYASITSITLVNNTSKTQDITVPTDTLYYLQSIKATNPDDVARTITIALYNEAAKTNKILVLLSTSIGAAGEINWPSSVTGSVAQSGLPNKLLLGPFMTISVTWSAGGASAGGTDADGLVVFVRRLPLT